VLQPGTLDTLQTSCLQAPIRCIVLLFFSSLSGHILVFFYADAWDDSLISIFYKLIPIYTLFIPKLKDENSSSSKFFYFKNLKCCCLVFICMDAKVDEYIKKQNSPQKEISQRLRIIILRSFPGISEEMKAGVPCYGSTTMQPCGKFYIAALKDHVNLGCSLKDLTKQQRDLFEGSGKTMKHIKVFTVEEIDEKKIISLLKIIK
jgi:hypothetical protein